MYKRQDIDRIDELVAGNEITIGSLRIMPILSDHSAAESFMFLIQADNFQILHTGDFRLHGLYREELLSSVKKLGKIDLLITEGTTLSRKENANKAYTEEVVEEFMRNCVYENKYCFTILSSTNFDRFKDISDSVDRYRMDNYPRGKYFVIDEFQKSLFEIAEKRLPDRYLFRTKTTYGKNIDAGMEDKGFIMMIRASKADHEALLRKYLEEYPEKTVLIYSMWSGYMKKGKLKELTDMARTKGCLRVIHSSGHVTKHDLESFIEMVESEKVIVIHTEKSEGLDNLKNQISIEDGETKEFDGRYMDKLRLSKKITRDDSGNCVILKLNGKTIKEDNMQTASNAFEGWACAIRAKENKEVVLDVDKETISEICLNDSEYTAAGNGHICRFLYRVIKFQEQYKWFSLTENLKGIVKDFNDYLSKKDISFVNNPPTKDAEDNSNKENLIESKLAEKQKLREIIGDTIDSDVYRQLPVGLFVNEKSKDNAIFTCGHSAIDLWSIKDDTISIVELKAKNRMIGIITEIFFYVNYMNDFISPRSQYRFEFAKPLKYSQDSDDRGYSKLYDSTKNEEIKKVVGIMLADDEDGFHTYIDQSVIDVMNDNEAKLKYMRAMYHITDFSIIKSKKEN